MAMSNGGFLHGDRQAPSSTVLPPWLSNSNATSAIRPPASPSVTLSLSPAIIPTSPTIPWLQPERASENASLGLRHLPSHGALLPCAENLQISELVECCKELEEGHRAWVGHKKEAVWRLRGVELQLESEKESRKRKKLEDIEEKVKTLREEQKITLDRIEAEYTEQLAGLRRDAEAKEQKLAEQWGAKHLRLAKFLEQMGCRSMLSEPNSQ